MIPFDLTALLATKLDETNRAPDGKLHASGDMVGSLRHTMLAAAGAPQLPEDIGSRLRLLAGTAIHDYFETEVFRGLPIMTEVKLDPYLPFGWSGTADWLIWDADRRAFVLGDLKTIKPGGINRIHAEGIKEAHMWQVSAYWHACAEAGLPLVEGAVVYYVPLGQLTASEGAKVEPTIQVMTPYPRKAIAERMGAIQAQVAAYLATLPPAPTDYPALFVTGELAPVQERVIKYVLNKKLKRPAIDVMMAPHWSTAYCPFPDELCNCRHQTTNKFGQFDRSEDGQVVYVPGAKVPAHTAPPAPAAGLIRALVKAQAGE